jgi:transcriptional regulator with XRE-family HTH domain
LSAKTEAHDRAAAFRRAELASFLRRKREATRPEDVGLPAGERRRTPGLRREEVAVLAHVGVSWYTWIEQGRELTMSVPVLEGIARALRLTPAENAYLREVAGVPLSPSDDDDLPPQGQQELLDSVQGRPAYSVDRYWTVMATNRMAEYVFGVQPGRNCLVDFFMEESVAQRYPHRDAVGRMLVAQFREHAARYAGDVRFADLIDELKEHLPAFRCLWDAHIIGMLPHGDLVYDHPHLGNLTFSTAVLTPFGVNDVRVFVYIPTDGTPTAALLDGVA